MVYYSHKPIRGVLVMNKPMRLIIVALLCVGILSIAGCSNSGGAPQNVLRARDWGIEEARKEGIDIPQNALWSVQNTTPPMLLGYTKYTFTFGRFRIEVGYPVVLYPIYAVVIFEDGAPVWEGAIEEPNLP